MKIVKRQASREEHVDTEGSWAVSYGDMITLLLSFFVLYFTVDHEKVQQETLEQSLMMALSAEEAKPGRSPDSAGAQAGAAGAQKAGEGKDAAGQLNQGPANEPGKGEQAPGSGKESATLAGKGESQKGHSQASQVGAGRDQNVGDKKQAGTNDKTGRAPAEVDPELMEKWNAKVYKVGKRVIVDFPGQSFFDLSKIEPNKEGRETLVQFARKFVPYAGSYVVGVRAFTDERTVRQGLNRRYQDNLELSALRSIAAMRILQKNGLPISRMRIGGWGVLKLSAQDLENMPAAATLRDPKALSRKVIFVIEADQGES